MVLAPAYVSSVTTLPLPTPSPHLLSCARLQCFTLVTEALAASPQGPVRSLWLWEASPGTYGKRVHSVAPHAPLRGCKTKSHKLSSQPSPAGQQSGLPSFLPWRRHRQHLAHSCGSSPIFSPMQGGKRQAGVTASAQYLSGLTWALCPLWGLRQDWSAHSERRVCGVVAGSAWSRELFGAPPSTPQCLCGQDQRDGDRLFPVVLG